jgi:GrpB-like predicted nucleotidyltransferase (UPF0157 family)
VGEPIVISEYDSRWPELFCELRDALPAGLRMRVRSIEHVGSTAVPGLAAKPIIDIDVVVADEADVAEAIALLSAAGYPHNGDAGVPGREAFDQPPHLPEHHLYVCAEGAGPLVAHLQLRDYLRANPGTACEYATLKRHLAATYGDDRGGYTEAKTALIEAVLPAGRVRA